MARTPGTGSSTEGVPDCRSCQHYFVTYEARWPHGCRAFGAKSRRLPCFEVVESSGTQCRGWEAKPAQRTRSGRPSARGGRAN